MMPTERSDSDSRKLLRRLRDVLAADAKGQDRLDRITHLIADSMAPRSARSICSAMPKRWNFVPPKGLRNRRVHQTRMKLGEGLVGRVARTGHPGQHRQCPGGKGISLHAGNRGRDFSSFLGVPIQRVGELGVLVVQSKTARQFSEDEVYALEVVAMVLAEMTELGAFSGEGMAMLHKQPVLFRGSAPARKVPPKAVSGCMSRAWW
jgi:phosphotransferase system, enzyme I, PtsP